MKGRSALYIASEYRVAEIREKRHEHNLEARHASGYFDRVWSVHPMADLVGAPKGKIRIIPFSPRQGVVEGVSEAFNWPRILFPLNFLLSQACLIRLLLKIIRRQHISVIVTTDPFYSGLLGIVLKWLSGRPLVVRIGGNYDELYRASGALAMPRLLPSYRLQNMVADFVLSRADLTAANNRNNLDFALAHGASEPTAIIPISGNIERIHLVPPEQRNGAETVFARLGVKTGGPILLFLGRLIPLKQPDLALRAMAIVLNEVESARAIFAGAGPMEEPLKVLAKELGVAGRVHFIGQASQHDLFEIIPKCITISPVTGLALIECGLGGSPIVAFDRDWQAEFIDDGVNGFVVPADDWKAMGERALELVRDPSLAERFSSAIRQTALRMMDVDEIRRLEKQAFDMVLGVRN